MARGHNRRTIDTRNCMNLISYQGRGSKRKNGQCYFGISGVVTENDENESSQIHTRCHDMMFRDSIDDIE